MPRILSRSAVVTVFVILSFGLYFESQGQTARTSGRISDLKRAYAAATATGEQILQTLSWHTFFGGDSYDNVSGIAVDLDGNIYVVGQTSSSTFVGSPISPFLGEYDIYVAKLNSSGALQWYTFLGDTSDDQAGKVAVDTSGNVYVVGRTILPSDGDYSLVAKLNTSGVLLWKTYLGGPDYDEGEGIALDGSGNIYVAGASSSTWGTPLNPFSGGNDVFLAKLSGPGVLQWMTFIGGTSGEGCLEIVADSGGNVYIAGESSGTWGSPVRAFSGVTDAFVAKLTSSGAPQWHTFLGGTSSDQAQAIAKDDNGDVYVTGDSYLTWGTPVRAFGGGHDAFVAKLDGSGALQWNTFLGGSSTDVGTGIGADAFRNVLVTGFSFSTWGTPDRPYTYSYDMFAARLDSNGNLNWNTFLGGNGTDYSYGSTLSPDGTLYISGHSNQTWGEPLYPYYSDWDAQVVKVDKAGGPHGKKDFNGDGQEDILWRYHGAGGYQGWNVVWLMNHTGGFSPLTTLAVSQDGTSPTSLLKGSLPSVLRETPLDAINTQVFSPGYTVTSPMGIDALNRKPKRVMRSPIDYGRGLTGGLPAMKDAEMAAAASGGEARIAALGIDGYQYLNTISDITWEIAGTGDFNSDGNTDILWRNYGAGPFSGWNVIWYMNGTGGIDGYGYLSGITDLTWKIVGTGDFDGDEDTDILWRNYGAGPFSGWNVIWYMNNAGGITGYGYLPGITDLDWKIVGTGDFDLDRDTDILWRNTGTGAFSGWNVVWHMAGEGISGYGYLNGISDLAWQIAGTGDFNSDGYMDILWRNYGTGGLQGWNCVWYMQGEGIIGYDYPMTITDTNWRIVNH
jgi:hypothetical protein